MKYFSKVNTYEEGGTKTGVKFSQLEIGTYFTNVDSLVGGDFHQKISNGEVDNTHWFARTNEPPVPVLVTFDVDDLVYICDVKIEWRVR